VVVCAIGPRLRELYVTFRRFTALDLVFTVIYVTLLIKVEYFVDHELDEAELAKYVRKFILQLFDHLSTCSGEAKLKVKCFHPCQRSKIPLAFAAR